MTKKKRNYILLIIIFVLIWKELWWLALLLVSLITLYLFSLKLVSVIKFSFFKKGIRGLFIFLFIFSIAISIKLFLGDIYKIPSSSMEDTLFTNDIILVNKLKYGPKLPQSPFEIPWVNIAFYFNDKAKARIHENWWEHKRLSGYSKVKNGDILVYEYFKKNSFFVKRCVGIAGDTLTLKATNIYINKVKHLFAKTVRKEYQFKVSDNKLFYKKTDSLQINEYIQRGTGNPNYRTASLLLKDKEKIEKLSMVDSLQPAVKKYNPSDELFARPRNTKWTAYDLGPIIIPKKGMPITLNEANYAIYRTAINLHESVYIEKKESDYFINGEQVKSYVFKQDYYFMMGDHRNGSYDSRFIGFIPEEKIVGKVQCILWSNYQNEFQWSRFLKKIE